MKKHLWKFYLFAFLLLSRLSPLKAQELTATLAGTAGYYDRTAEFPWDNVRDINALGLNAMFVPEAYGGAGLSYAAYLACVPATR